MGVFTGSILPPVDYQSFGARRVMRCREGRWHPPEGEYLYLEIELLELRID